MLLVNCLFKKVGKEKEATEKKKGNNLGLIIHTFREGNGTPLQYFCLENPMDRGAW